MEKMVDITDSNLFFFKNHQTGEIIGELWANGYRLVTWAYGDMPSDMKTLAIETFRKE